MLNEYFAAHPLDGVEYRPQFPLATDRAVWDALDPADRADLTALGERWHETPWPVLTAGMYAAFMRTGSRRDCENPYFDRRRKLCAAAMHLCVPGEDSMLSDVEVGLWML